MSARQATLAPYPLLPKCDGARVHFEYSKVLAQGPDANRSILKRSPGDGVGCVEDKVFIRGKPSGN